MFLTQLLLLLNGCIHASDFAIYQQAIFDIAAGISFNPYLSIRDLNIFNDHFDPILILAAPFARVFNYRPESLIIFEFLWFAALLSFAWLKSKSMPFKYRVMVLTCILFSKGLLSGLTFPIHPSTWAMLPAFLIAYYLCTENKRGVVLSALLLCFFRESFPFAVIALGVSLFILNKRWRNVGLLIFSFGSLFQIFNYVLRPMLLGEVMNYGGYVLNENMFSMLMNNDYIPLIKILYPFIPILLFAVYKLRHKIINDPIIHVLAFISPLLAIHIITGKFHFQYGAQFSAPLLAVIGFHPRFSISKTDNRFAYITVLLSVLSSMSIYTKSLDALVLSKSNKCEISKENKNNLEDLTLYFQDNITETDSVLVTGGLAPILMQPDRKIYQAGMFSKKLDHYDYAFISRLKKTDTYPFDYELNDQFKDCEIIFSNSSIIAYKNLGLNCLPDVLKPTLQE